MNEEYQKGQQIGEIQSDIKNLTLMLKEHNDKQDEWNKDMNQRVVYIEGWMQTTIGKVTAFSVVAGVVGSAIYFIVNWLINRK